MSEGTPTGEAHPLSTTATSPGLRAAAHRSLPRAAPVALVTGILALLVLSGLAGAVPMASFHAPGAAPSAASAGPAVSGAGLPTARLAPHPAAGGMTGVFWANSTNLGAQPSSNAFCNPSTFPQCMYQAMNPSIMTLANGSLGASFAITTSHTASTCAMATGNVTAQVGWSISTDNGTTWGPITYLANTTCPFYQALEPSFAVGGDGVVYGTFVEANATSGQINQPYSAPMVGYASRPDDALAFTTSSDNGTTFSAVRTIVGGGNIARPALAAFGDSVYVVYENITNGTTLSTLGGSAQSIALYLVYSNDGGATWRGPYTLPGLNPSQGNNTMSPSISVNPSGTLAVAYATNRGCIAYCALFPQDWGDDIVVATSSTNGSTWSSPHTVAAGVGESEDFLGGVYMPTLFEYAPETSVAWGSPTALYVAYAGSTNVSSTGGSAQYYDYSETSIFGSVSTNSGTSWTTTQLSQQLPKGQLYPYAQDYFNPGVAVGAGVAYVTYSYLNSTTQCGLSTNLYGNYADTQWLTNYTGGQWSASSLLMLRPASYPFWNFAGWTAGITFDTSGRAVPIYAVDAGYTFTPSFSFEAQTFVETSTVYAGPTTSLTVNMTGLTVGTLWNVEVDGAEFTSMTANLTVANVPADTTVYLAWNGPYVFTGFQQILIPIFSLPLATTLTGPTNMWANFTTFDGITFNIQPPNAQYIDVNVADYTPSAGYLFNFYHAWDTYTFGGTVYSYQYGCPFPWYVPAGSRLNLSNGYSFQNGVFGYYTAQGMTVGYWNGTGAGSYTGPGTSASLVVSSPFNETLWCLSFGVYTESFNAPTLPSTSTYSFGLDGNPYSGTGGTPVQVTNVTTGPHRLTSIQATSSQSGWQYFGWADTGNPVIVPLTPNVNFSFAYVDTGAPTGTVSFHATGLTSGTVWQFAFNGTTYSSSTPWINVTTHPGTYPQAAFPVVAQNGSAGYAPLALPPTINVTTGQTYDISFSSAYRIQVVVGQGGTISPTNTSYWVAPGTTKSITVSVLPGYTFLGWSGTGLGSYSGTNLTATVTANGPIVETANFVPLVPNRFSLTFNETGIPAGTWWTVYLDGTGFSTDQSTLTVSNLYSCTVSGSLGRYTVAVPYAFDNATSGLRYVPGPYAATACGGSGPISLAFGAEVLVTATATSGGTASVSALSQAGLSLWDPVNQSVALQATANSGYRFVGWSGTGLGSYTGTTAILTIQPYGPVTEVATFEVIPQPAPATYTVTFTLSTQLASGTAWTVTLGSTSYSTTGTSLTVTGLSSGTYPLVVGSAQAPDGLTQYTPAGTQPSVDVTHNLTVPVAFLVSYWVTVNAAGPGTVSPNSGWFAARSTVTLRATPTGDAIFVSWSGTGTGAYSGTSNETPVTVTAPIVETASFAPAPTPPATASTSFWQNPTYIALFAIVGIVVGLAVGLALTRMRRGPTPPPETPPAESPEAAESPSAEPSAWSEEPPAAPPEESPSEEVAP